MDLLSILYLYTPSCHPRYDYCGQLMISRRTY